MPNTGISLTSEQRALLEQWGKKVDRSMSSMIRWLIDREKERRDQERTTETDGAQNPEQSKPTA